MSVLEFILRHMMVFLEDILMKVFLISPFYPEEWSLMRVINTFLLWCALIFLVCGVLLEWFSFWVAAGIFLAGCLIRLAVGKMLE